jgi:uncharacterized protein
MSKDWRVKFSFPSDNQADPMLLQGLGGPVKGSDRYESMLSSITTNSRGSHFRPDGSGGSHRGASTPEAAIDRFTRRMRDIGIKRSVIFDSIINLGILYDADLEVAICNAYVDYMLDHFLGKYDEINIALPVPSGAPDKAADLIDRVGSERGVVAAFLTPVRPGSLFGDESYNVIYERLQKKGIPILVHGYRYRGAPVAEFHKMVALSALGFPWWYQKQFTSIIVDGVVERYPGIKWVWVEGGIGWVPWLKHRLDLMYEYYEGDCPELTKMPSEYIKEFYFTSQPLEQQFKGSGELENVFKEIDAENHLLYSSDFPHPDFDAPAALYDIPFLTKEAKQKIMGGNAHKVFNKLR